MLNMYVGKLCVMFVMDVDYMSYARCIYFMKRGRVLCEERYRRLTMSSLTGHRARVKDHMMRKVSNGPLILNDERLRHVPRAQKMRRCGRRICSPSWLWSSESMTIRSSAFSMFGQTICCGHPCEYSTHPILREANKAPASSLPHASDSPSGVPRIYYQTAHPVSRHCPAKPPIYAIIII
jgi:hypothetical protein